MNFTVKSLLLLLSFIGNCINSIGQKQIDVNNEAELQRLFATKVVKHNDTISIYVKNNGILFLRFLLNNEGAVDSVKCSGKQPKKLIEILTETLMAFKFPVTNNNNDKKYFVLPVYYDYLPDFTPKQLLDDPTILAPKIDVEDFNSYMNFDFNGLFKVEDSKRTLWGINCVLLPMVKVGLARTYRHSSSNLQAEQKSKLKL